MLFKQGLTIQLSEREKYVPFLGILGVFMQLRFERRGCYSALQRMLRDRQLDEGLLRPEAILLGDTPGSSELLFYEPQMRDLKFLSYDRSARSVTRPLTGMSIELAPEDLGGTAEMIRFGASTDDIGAFVERYSELDADALTTIVQPPGDIVKWPVAAGVGIHRREHACIEVQTATARVIIDPLTPFSQLAVLSDFPHRGEARPDAILITHTHADHWHLPSILMTARDATVPVVVPQVKPINILAPFSPENELRLCGQEVMAPAWGTVVKVGDMEIDVLPFYGEQPCRDAPGPSAGIRNHGNCYRINAPGLSILVIADGGDDPDGSMVEVARRSAEQRGPVDVVLACLRHFPSPFFGGQSCYWATLPFARLEELFGQYQARTLPSTTAGPAGVARICEAAKARYFLPYAHGFASVGQPIKDIGWGGGEPSEADRLAQLAREIEQGAGTTSPLAWNCGDHATFHEGKIAIRSQLA